MRGDWLQRVILRDLNTLRDELRAYAQEEDLWISLPGTPNSAGTLVLHLTGNLQHFIGAQLGATGYVRDREAEFADRHVPRAELERRIDHAIAAVEHALDSLPHGALEREYPRAVSGARLPTGLFLTHLATHLAYHLGQIDYHRRILTANTAGVGAQSIPALVSVEP
ncbi:MAG: DUF1572 family protein [Gemmatimonadales bacterium]|nr:DUF1572 family protein [Gemmatimonadales bacterium]